MFRKFVRLKKEKRRSKQIVAESHSHKSLKTVGADFGEPFGRELRAKRLSRVASCRDAIFDDAQQAEH